MGIDPQRLKALRKERKLTQEQLGKALHVTKVSVSGYESGNRTPDTETLKKMADYFQVSTDYLLGRTEDTSFLYNVTQEEMQSLQEHLEFLRYRASKKGD